MNRKKTSLTLHELIWSQMIQQYALTKYGNSRNANTELEIAMKSHMKNNPISKRTESNHRGQK